MSTLARGLGRFRGEFPKFIERSRPRQRPSREGPSRCIVRELQALTQTQLAEKARVSIGTISRIERGAEAVPPTVKRLAEALGVEPSALVES